MQRSAVFICVAHRTPLAPPNLRLQILTGRTEKRQIGSRAGNTFSVATFAVDDKPRAGRPGQAAKQQQEETNREFWESLLPEAVAAHDEQVRNQHLRAVANEEVATAQGFVCHDILCMVGPLPHMQTPAKSYTA